MKKQQTTKKENQIEYLKLDKEENNSTIIIGNKKYDRNLVNKTYDFQKEHFIILRRRNGFFCGLFSYYSVHLGCIILYLSKGYIPIIDVSSFSNIFNNFIPSNDSNPWEILFNQPFNYTLAEVKKNAKHIINLPCKWTNMASSEGQIYTSQLNLKFHREMARKYMSVKKEIIDEGDKIWKKLFDILKFMGYLQIFL